MTKLNTPVHREVTINGEAYVASLMPAKLNTIYDDETGVSTDIPEFTLRKKRHKQVYRQSMPSLIEELDSEEEQVPYAVGIVERGTLGSRTATIGSPPTFLTLGKGKVRKTHADSLSSDPEFSVSELKDKLAASEMDYKLKVEVLKAVVELFDIEKELDATRTLNP